MKIKRKERHRWTPDFPVIPQLLATSFGAGFLPLAPGTWGAIVGILVWLPFYIFCDPYVTLFVNMGLTIFFTVAGVMASNVAEEYWDTDPVEACVDETAGQLLSLQPMWFVPWQQGWWMILVSLALFRFFDIFKPLGIRRMERLPGGAGMMADDLLAGLYTLILVFVLNYFIFM